MDEERIRSCCFTGHRPEKLPWRYDEDDPRCDALKRRIMEVVRSVYEGGVRHYICGMAKGCDTYFAEAVIEFREERGDVTLEAAIPCEGQASRWSSYERRRYYGLVHRCDRETLLRREYTPECMLERNRYMVDHSSVLIAAFDGTFGGTMQTVNYARRSGLTIITLPIL